MSDAPVDLSIATYSDPGAAPRDWDGIKQLARDNVITVDGLVLENAEQVTKHEVDSESADKVKATATSEG